MAGNYIGTDATGTALGNGRFGVYIGNGATHNMIGTNGDGVADASERNLLSANIGDGVRIVGTDTNENVVAGNYIGTDRFGTAAVPNRGWSAVVIAQGAASNRIGTNGDSAADEAEGNLISGNLYNGVLIADAGTMSNVVAGNFIGTTVSGQSRITLKPMHQN